MKDDEVDRFVEEHPGVEVMSRAQVREYMAYIKLKKLAERERMRTAYMRFLEAWGTDNFTDRRGA